MLATHELDECGPADSWHTKLIHRTIEPGHKLLPRELAEKFWVRRRRVRWNVHIGGVD